MKLKFTALFAVLILLPAVLFAVPVVVTWEWLLEDPEVTTFRFQIDSEDPEGWITVDSSVTSYTEQGLDGTVDHTLYLQQSYDGIHFSESTRSVAEAFVVVPEAPPVVEAPAAPVASSPAPPQPEAPAPEVKKAEPVAKSPKAPKAKEPRRFYTKVGINLGYNRQRSRFNSVYDINNLKGGMTVEFHNILSFAKVFGLGVDLDFDYSPYLRGSYRSTLSKVLKGDFGALSTFFRNLEHSFTVSPAVMLNVESGRLALGLGGGGFYTYSLDDMFIDGSTLNYRYGVFAKAALSYRLTDHFTLGIGGKYGVDLDKFASGGHQFLEATMSFGYIF
ncbi:MAG: hypothetical protein GX911_02680 [Spirochaetales bacterium]|nr:hypothetical protein [Spirochaetales bacterium]